MRSATATTHPIRRAVGAAIAAFAAICIVAVPAAAIPDGGASPDTPGTSSSVSPKSLQAGQTISFTVRGFPAGELLNIKIDDGLFCSESGTHGACVVHQQRIPGNGVVSGSLTLPGDLKPGKHWLRYLASEELTDAQGNYLGVKGYTLRGGSDFTIVAASAQSSGSSGTTSSGSSSARSGSAASSSGSGQAASTRAGSAQSGGSASSGTTGAAASGAVTETEVIAAGEIVAVRPFRQGGGADVNVAASGPQSSDSDLGTDELVDDDPERLPGGDLEASGVDRGDTLFADGFPLVGLVSLVVLLGVAGRLLLRNRSASRD